MANKSGFRVLIIDVHGEDSRAGMDYSNKQKYWQYQFRLGMEYLIPQLERWGVRIKGANVLDVGCAEAGLLCAMASCGAWGTGIELSPSRLQWARIIAMEQSYKLQLIAADFFYSPLKPGRPFDLIVLRDVFEHLPDKPLALGRLREMMSGQTHLLLTYPPFYSPFGGHQQVLQSFWRRIPYFHILPDFFWTQVKRHIRRVDHNAAFLTEMENLRQHRVTISQVKKLTMQQGLKIAAVRYYYSRPSYKIRYGWPVLEAKIISRIPILRELFVTGVTMVIEKNE